MANPSSVSSSPFAHVPMRWRQVVAVALAVALNALDGFDVLAITFAAPDVAREWGISPSALGVALSAGLAGMCIGSLFLAPVGDRFGRRPLVNLCLVLMTAGMFLTATSGDVFMLCVWRFLTGLGIGGMVAAINAVSSEFANERNRNFCVALMTIGFPLGGLLGGFALAEFAETHHWTAIFVIGGVVTAIFLPLVWLFVPESVEFLHGKNTPEANARAEAILKKLGHADLASLPAPTPTVQLQSPLKQLLGPYLSVTVLLVLAYFLHMLAFYFFSSWLPKLMSDFGFETSVAIRTSAIMSTGGILGGALLGWVARRFDLFRLVAISMAASAVALYLFGTMETLTGLQIAAFLTGFFIFGGIVGLYALIARSYPPELRVTGTGLAVGTGRGGAVLGPIVGGILIQAGASIGTAIAVVGGGTVVAALLILALKRVKQGLAAAQ